MCLEPHRFQTGDSPVPHSDLLPCATGAGVARRTGREGTTRGRLRAAMGVNADIVGLWRGCRCLEAAADLCSQYLDVVTAYPRAARGESLEETAELAYLLVSRPRGT